MKKNIDANANFSLAIDETPDGQNDLSVTCLLYVADPRRNPKTLEIMLRDAPADAEGVSQLCFRGDKKYELESDNCSAICLDKAKYNESAFDRMTPYFRYAVCIFDTAHTLANAIVYGHQSSAWVAVKTWFKESRGLFINSLARKSEFKSFIRRRPVINDDGALDNVLSNMTPR